MEFWDTLVSSSGEAIALVGMACRLPGGIDDPRGLWEALAEGRDLVSPAPPEGRFDPARLWDPDPERLGRSYTFAGGYLRDVAAFDAAYFRISPSEARRMDPQQRLLLELTAEAFDDAAVDPAGLAGSDTAVFVGVSDMSYGSMQMTRPEQISGHTMSGNALSLTANRVSLAFDLRGPSMAVDTACSSSLVAVHQACEALRSGRCGSAIAGGVNVLVNPLAFVGFSRASMLSPKGRCAPFSAGATGYVRSEGGGVVLMKRLADAVAAGDRIHGVIVASGVNSDGGTSGLATPSAEMQRRLLEEVYGRAGIGADDLVYFEAHGTGTPVGDPVECEAIGQALGVRRATGALPIGSVKSNLGHGEPASGVTGLLKGVMVLRHGRIPASLHAAPANPDIDFAALNLAPVTGPQPLTVSSPGVVGVNSFGFGGANAHVVLAGSPQEPPPGVRSKGPLPLVVSARTGQALAEAATAMAGRLEEAGDEAFHDVCWTATCRRGRHEHRAAVLADTPEDAARQLASLAADGVVTDAVEVRSGGAGRVAFVFSGNGSQWDGMAADLMAAEPAFRAGAEEADAHLRPLLGWSVTELLAAPPPQDGERPQRPMTDTLYAQPALFTLQVGLVRLLESYGVRAGAVVGHSGGELTAAYVCGALDAASAARAVVERSRAQAATAGTGRMAVAALSPEEAIEAIAAYDGLLEIAAVNSARDVTLSGEGEALRSLGRALVSRDVAFRELPGDYAFHTAAMDGVEQELRRALTDLVPGEPRIPMYSTVTGQRVRPGGLDAEYWWRNMRCRVRFADAVRELAACGLAAVVEIGPQPTLRGALSRLAAERPQAPFTVVPAMDRSTAGPLGVRQAAARVLACGSPDADPRALFPVPGRVTDLPAYPWQHERHWHGAPEDWTRVSGDGVLVHPLLGERLPTLEPAWYATVERTRTPWLGDHNVGGAVVMPATGYVELALAAGREVFAGPVELDTIDIPRGLPLPWDATMDVRLQTSLSDEDGIWRVASRTGEMGPWRMHARGRARRLATPTPPRDLDLAAVRARMTSRMDAEQLYAMLTRAELRYGQTFRALRDIHFCDQEVLASYHCSPSEDGYGGYMAFPPLLDAAWHSCAALLSDAQTAYLPSAIGRVRVWRTPPPTGWVHLRQRLRTPREVVCDITVADDTGAVAVTMDGCRMQSIPARAADDAAEYITVLRAAPLPGRQPDPLPPIAPGAMLAAAQAELDSLRADGSDARHARAVRIWRGGTGQAICKVFRTLVGGREEFTLEDLFQAGVERGQERYLWMLISMAERFGNLRRDGEAWRFVSSATDAPVRDFLLSVPDNVPSSVLSVRALLHTPDVLCGKRDPMELFVEGAELVQQFYDVEPVVMLHNRFARALLRKVVEAWPADRPLRVLEVGAGTGGLTAWLLPVLPADRTRYVFTDVSPMYFAAAQARFAESDCLEYRPLDLDADPVEQGFEPAGFDVIVAGFSLHTAKGLSAAVRRLATLCAPGGHLLAVEVHNPQMLVPIFGALESFWSHEGDELRPESLLLSRDRWPSILRENGFDDVVQTGAAGPPISEEFSVLMARRQGTVPPAAPVAASAQPAEPLPWLLVTEDDSERNLTQALTDRLLAAGSPHVRVLPAADARAGTYPARDAHPARWGIAYLLSAEEDRRVEEGTPEEVVDLALNRLATLRAIARDRGTGGGLDAHRFVLVSHPTGALPAPERPEFPGQAAAWGAARVMAAELPALSVARVSLERGADPDTDALRLVAELQPAHEENEDEVVLTRGGRFVPRVIHAPRTVELHDGTATSHRLTVDRVGLGYRLAWDQAPTPRPGPGEVTIALRAVALNYRDVLVVTGLLPALAEEGLASEEFLGMEGSGVVTAVGPGVTGIAVGDRVYGVMYAGTSHTCVPAHVVRRIPEGMTFTEAATLPVAFLTAQRGLETLARLRKDETVLVHGGAGGVGLAALQHAHLIGAKVIATAGSPVKRDLLTVLGVEHVFDSRDLRFADQVRELTGGRGVDVVLNSLSGEAAARSMEVLAPGGRFVELGKRDLYANSRMQVKPLADNASLHVMDLGRLAFRLHELLPAVENLHERVRTGAYRPLLHQAYPATRAQDAFQLLQHSRHIGKVLLTFDEPVPVSTSPEPEAPDPQGSYLVVGGLSGLGARTAVHLAERGARHLALVGRRGMESPEARSVLARLAAHGATVNVHAADVTDTEAMREIMRQTDTAEHPLRGIIHSVLHLEDGELTDLSDEHVRAVLAPKMAGTLILDQCTRGKEVPLTVYSSLNAWIGNHHQANYAAANLYTEAFTRKRRHQGQPGMAIAWGAIGETGYVARRGLTAAVAMAGLMPVSPDQACAALDHLHAHNRDVAAYARCDWSGMTVLAPSVTRPRFRSVVPPPLPGTGYRLEELLTRLDGVPPEEALQIMEEAFIALVADILQMPAEQIDPTKPLREYGMDSLMAMEVMSKVRKSFQYDVPVMEVLHSDGSVRGISETLLSKLTAGQTAPGRVLRAEQPVPSSGDRPTF
ncbi:SDR family NAD(P)-dependent oxidoreductase [Streptomyces sp. NPDC021100]|uniref:SDR family NAD(P)-dependent oxidoreductase n=1 Tax=Streptomyces sp. NPDC021100 TaxID=3365114 RepID=UPI0037B46FC0